MKSRELHQVLGKGKLKFKLQNRRRHCSYELWLSGRELHLPRLVTLPFGNSGEVPSRVISGCAHDLGLSETEFLVATACDIGRPCVLLALAVFCQEAKERFALDRENGWHERIHPLDHTICGILADVESSSQVLLTQQEGRLIQRLYQRPFNREGVGTSIQTQLHRYLSLSIK